MQTKKENHLVQLRDNLNHSFDRNELQSLFFDLGVDYDSLPNKHKNGMIQELILLLGRQQRLPELVALGRELRPQLEWPDISSSTVQTLIHSSEPVQLSKKEWKERKKQLILLEKVKQFWVEGYLEKSVPEDRMLELGRQSYPEAIDSPWHDIVDTAVFDSHTLDSYQNIYDIFIESDRALLILGQPGAGKTTTMLQLVHELVALAETTPTEPIPAVFNLSTWAETKTDLISWVIEELTAKYQIPRKISRPWVENDELIIFFDGLDEVPADDRKGCVQAINQFRHEYGLTGVVVCSRTEEYKRTGIQLKLGGAILLDTLTPQQIDAYLENAGPQFAELRSTIQNDAALKDMAQSPLMLNLMSDVYQETPEIFSSPVNTTEEPHEPLQHKIFSAYVQNKLSKVDANYKYTQSQIAENLTWLAQKMSTHNQIIFLLERIQPSWISGHLWRWAYLLLTRFTLGIGMGSVLWLGILIAAQMNIPIVGLGFFLFIAEQLQVSISFATAIALLGGNIFLGLVVGSIDIYRYQNSLENAKNIRTRNRQKIWFLIGMGLGIAILTYALYISFGGAELSFLFAFVTSSFWTTALALLFRWGYENDIKIVEGMKWSWPDAFKSLPFGLMLSIVFILIALLAISDLYLSLVIAMNYFLIIFFFGGIRPLKLEATSYPNQGIKISMRSSLSAMLMFGLPAGVLFTVFVNINAGILAAIFYGWGGLWLYGGIGIFWHWIVRLFLRYQSEVPLNLVPFLNSTVKLSLMYRVGGGYIFIHRLLQDYFANLTIKPEA